jgi:hypothetical protein
MSRTHFFVQEPSDVSFPDNFISFTVRKRLQAIICDNILGFGTCMCKNSIELCTSVVPETIYQMHHEF